MVLNCAAEDYTAITGVGRARNKDGAIKSLKIFLILHITHLNLSTQDEGENN